MRPEKIIYNSSKIMYMSVGKGLNICLIDSLNFLPMKLSALPKAFGFAELKKGYFPHFFNTQEHQHYVGALPEPKFYGCDYMSSSERSDFLAWHEENKDTEFDFAQEMLDYCRSDVDILRQTCLKFCDLMANATGHYDENGDLTGGVDPFDYVTIAAACMGIFMTKFLEETWRVKVNGKWFPAKKLDGYFMAFIDNKWTPDLSKVTEREFVKSAFPLITNDNVNNQHSKISIQWLEWISHAQGLNIQHALNGGEKKIAGSRYKADGFANKTVYEFNGCFYHGCPTCYPNDRDVKHDRTDRSHNERHALTLKKEMFVKQAGMRCVNLGT